jgi:sulfatase modifying factor 1
MGSRCACRIYALLMYGCAAHTEQPELRSSDGADTPSCVGLAVNCGPTSGESCCLSPTVTGGSFERDNNPSYPATISSFRLDKYEVTVGRFRKFVDAVMAGWLPPPGSGKHGHLNHGDGLSNSAAPGNELGWEATWNTNLPALKADWDSSSYLACDPAYATWTSSPGSNENLPINCVNWYQSAAFCIWDDGFMPSNAEGNYAAAGGNEQRVYPWGATFPSGSTALAVFGCYLNANGNCTGFSNIAPVGSVAAGNGRYGQADLAGNVAEWNLDWDAPYTTSACHDCAYLQPQIARVERGGSFFFYASLLPSTAHDGVPPAARSFDLGLRCARAP